MIKPRLYRGMRDIEPAEMEFQEIVLAKVQELFKKFGFLPLKTPAIEYLDILTGKYGEESEKLFYNLAYGDGHTLALRYDLTVPLARYIAMHTHELPNIFKRYQIQQVWRAERAQPRQGRFREFLQCDVDIIGSNSLVSDAEIIAISIECLEALGFKNYSVKLNHRVLLKGLLNEAGVHQENEMVVCRILDKIDKIGMDKVKAQLEKDLLEPGQIKKLFTFFDSKADNEQKLTNLENMKLNKDAQKGIEDLKTILGHLNSFNISQDKIEFDPALARGLDYYTGSIFETVLLDHPHIGSLTGGGRYDNLIGVFIGRDIPACGTTVGLDRIVTALSEMKRLDKKIPSNKVLVTILDENYASYSIKLASKMRKEGITVDLFPEPASIRYQLSYADKMNIEFVLLIGENEIKNKMIRLKNMKTGEQTDYPEDLIIKEIKKLTDKKENGKIENAKTP
ncbi:histidine--tRNA ligase [bacterium]|nr:histidine--tRNA ligase [bacterium]